MNIKHGQYSLKIHELCNEKCIFCFQDHETRKDKKILSVQEGLRKIYEARKTGYRNISFTGGEPLIHKHILVYIRFAKKVGFISIGVHTNGVRLADEEFSKNCIKAGLNTISLSLHHINEEINDKIVGKINGTSAALKGIDVAIGLGIYPIVHLVVNRLNFRDLPIIAEELFRRRVLQLVIMFPTLQGGMKEYAESAMIEYHEFLPFLQETLLMLKGTLGRYIYLFNIPPCLVPGYEKYVMTGINGALKEIDDSLIEYFQEKKKTNTFIPECDSCEKRSLCNGFDLPYIDYYGKNVFSNMNVSSRKQTTLENIVRLIIGTKQESLEQEGEKFLGILQFLLSKPYQLGLKMAIFGFIEEKDSLTLISEILSDFYSQSKAIEKEMFVLRNTLKILTGYSHIEYAIQSENPSTYKYLLWFNSNDKKIEILNYVLLTFKINQESIYKILKVFEFFEEKENAFHLGIDPETKRMKLYISLYSEPVEEALNIILFVHKILNPGIPYTPESNIRKYDCIGIDIHKNNLDLKIYELLEIENRLLREKNHIKEEGYMKALATGRRKKFFRLEKNYELDIFGDASQYNKIINLIKEDAGGFIDIKGKVKYITKEGEKKELYFI